MEWHPKPLDPGMITLHRCGKGEPLMLLHCLGMSWRFWDVLEPLTDRFELIAYSFPGHHDTPLPGHQYGVPELTEQLRAVAKREGLSQFHLMGISLGGSVAQHFAGTYPDMVNKLILADCTPRACSGEGYALACEALATLDAREETKRVKAPTLILVGSEERKSFQDAADWMQATIPGSRKVTVPDAGHASVRDQPDFIVRTLRDFLG